KLGSELPIIGLGVSEPIPDSAAWSEKRSVREVAEFGYAALTILLGEGAGGNGGAGGGGGAAGPGGAGEGPEFGGGAPERPTFVSDDAPAPGTTLGKVTEGPNGFRFDTGEAPIGRVDFVIQNGEMTIGRGHYALSGGGLPVEYAGEIVFG